MKTNDKDIERMAKEYARKSWTHDPYDQNDIELAYELGFKACEAKMLAEAAISFDDWFSEVYDEATKWRDWQSCDNLHDNKHNMQKAFTDGVMSQAKKDAEELKLASEINRGLANANHDLSLRVKNLEDKIEELQEALEFSDPNIE
jgi:hypothetical protein